MTVPARLDRVSLIPPTAPFGEEQRVWLNGLFAGLLGLDGGAAPLSPEQAAGLLPGIAAPTALVEDDDDQPWHDQTLPLDERMKLAEGRPLRRRLMAAMAQQDCGQCGYNCRDYADALFARSEERLNLCVPGGKTTARMLKTLYQELGAPGKAPAAPAAEATPAARPQAAPGRSRDNPVEASIVSRLRLNKPGSEKDTWHIDFDLSESGLDYAVGNSFGVYAVNDPHLVDAVIRAIGADLEMPVAGRTLRAALATDYSLAPAPDLLFQLISYLTGGEKRQKAKALADGQDPDGDAATVDVLAALEKFPGLRPDPEAFLEALEPLQPRVYSISSSPKVDPDRVSLTVDAVRYRIGDRLRLGVASTHLAARAAIGERARVYVQKAQHFALPADPATPIVMIGPGTGVAPFRAFLHERMATRASGRNWLFFGHRRQATDFFYEEELSGMRAAGVLTRLTLAWSRDGKDKIYVQHRIAEVGRDFWSWLADGAHVYVCGDAKHMAKDVERAIVDVVAAHGARTTDEAIAFVAGLKKSGRYQQDVY